MFLLARHFTKKNIRRRNAIVVASRPLVVDVPNQKLYSFIFFILEWIVFKPKRNILLDTTFKKPSPFFILTYK